MPKDNPPAAVKYQATIAGDHSDRFCEKVSQISAVKNLIEEFLLQSPAYSMDRNYFSSGHEKGKGGTSKMTYTVKRNLEPGLLLEINESYWTTSDDLFDFGMSPSVSLELKDESLKELYIKLTEFFDQLR